MINKGGAGGNNTSANDIKRCSGAGGAAGYIGKGGDGGNAYPASTMYSQGGMVREAVAVAHVVITSLVPHLGRTPVAVAVSESMALGSMVMEVGWIFTNNSKRRVWWGRPYRSPRVVNLGVGLDTDLQAHGSSAVRIIWGNTEEIPKQCPKGINK